MTRLPLVLIMVVILFVPTNAGAQETPSQNPETTSLAVHGQPGTWFPRATANRLIADVEELHTLRTDIIPALNDKIHLSEEANGLLRENLRLTEQQVTIWKQSFDRLARQIRPRHVSWYETPIFWMSVGAVATGALAIGLAYGLREAR